MKLSLFISAEHRPDESMQQRLAEHVEQVRLAKEVGFDGVCIGSHLSYGTAAWFPPLETLMHLAPAAQDMQLATCMLVLPLHHPLHVAQQAALVDAACGGRLVLGVSPGWTEDEFKILGLDHGRRISRYLEGVTLLERLFTEENVTFAGKHFEVEGLTLALKPMQKPRPPMWFGGSVTKAVERAAQLSDTSIGDSWVASAHLAKDVIIEQADVFRQALFANGKGMPEEFPILRNIVVAPDKETAIREAGPFVEASYRVFGQWGLFTDVVGSDKKQLDFEELIAGRVIIGSPEECAEELAQLQEDTGFNRLITRIQWLGMDQPIVLRTIEMLGEKVLPLLRQTSS